MSTLDDFNRSIRNQAIPIDQQKKLEQTARYIHESESLQEVSRGKYLLRVAELDYCINEVIAYHFCHNKIDHSQMCSTVLQKINFIQKIKMLDSILDLYNDMWLRDVRNKMPKLDNIRRYRNKLAHCAPSFDMKVVQDTFDDMIHLRVYEAGKEITESYSKDDFEKHMSDLRLATSWMVAIRYYIRDHNKRNYD